MWWPEGREDGGSEGHRGGQCSCGGADERAVDGGHGGEVCRVSSHGAWCPCSASGSNLMSSGTLGGFAARGMWFSLHFQKISPGFAWTVDKERSRRAGRELEESHGVGVARTCLCIPRTWREF